MPSNTNLSDYRSAYAEEAEYARYAPAARQEYTGSAAAMEEELQPPGSLIHQPETGVMEEGEVQYLENPELA